MARRQIIAGNWKMYKTIPEAVAFVERLAPRASVSQAELYLAVPFTAISSAAQVALGSGLKIGAQNMHDAEEGAFTGEVAGRMLVDAGATFVLLGHSERRHLFGESNEVIRSKVARAFEVGLQPILCVGERLEERQAGRAQEVVAEQLTACLAGLRGKKKLAQLVVAYEPVWAIGTGETATPEQAEEMHRFCRSVVAERFGAEVAEGLPILYGGSVKPSNAAELLALDEIDGVLVGGASLDPDSFLAIVEAGVS